jgi:peptide/nickel transport system substrate-binding protein
MIQHHGPASEAGSESTEQTHLRMGDPESGNAIDRRGFLRRAGTVGAGLAGVGLLAGCGAATTTTAATGGAPKRGGTIRAALTGGSNTDSVGPWDTPEVLDTARLYQLYNQLVGLDNNSVPTNELASEVSATTSAWTIRVKSGITFHNGKELDAQDVLWNLQQIANPKSPHFGASMITPLDLASAKILDKYTVRIPTHVPYTIPSEVLASGPDFYIVPKGFNGRTPVGTGPFKYQSFTPGSTSVFVRNENYWESGLPYIDRLVITDFTDQTSQVNALQSGQADVIQGVTANAIPSITSNGGKVLIEGGSAFTCFTMRVDQPPFTDVRVRQAFKYMLDRPQYLSQVFEGHGLIGNDMAGMIFDPNYNHAVPQREHDLAKARSLLKAAGHGQGLNVSMVTTQMSPGAQDMAQVFKQQAASAGVTVGLQELTGTSYWGQYFLKAALSQDWYTSWPLITLMNSAFMKGGAFEETHYNSPRFAQLFKEATATTDKAKQREIVQEMQQLQYDEGGWIIPVYSPTIDGYASHVHGVHGAKTGQSFGNYDFKRMWLA